MGNRINKGIEKMKTVFVLTGSTESGDEIGPYVWPYKPTKKNIKDVFMRDIEEDYKSGSCQNYRVSEVNIEE